MDHGVYLRLPALVYSRRQLLEVELPGIQSLYSVRRERDMTDHHKEPNYMGVFYLLAVLTVLEIGVIYLPIGKLIIGFMLVIMALVKAALVGMYFMHLKFEKRTLVRKHQTTQI